MKVFSSVKGLKEQWYKIIRIIYEMIYYNRLVLYILKRLECLSVKQKLKHYFQ